MQALLSDPATIPFLRAGTINLHSLKHEIDRRIDKIRTLVMGAPLPRPHPTADANCQTEAAQRESNNVRLKHRRILSSHDSNLQAEPVTLCQERPSLPNRKKSNAKENQAPLRDGHNLRVRLTDYLTSKKTGSQAHGFPDLTSARSQDMEEAQEDKMFTAVEFKLHNSFDPPNFHIPFPRNPTAESLCSDDCSDNEGTEGRKSFSTVARRLASVRKTKFTERTALPEAVRITVSEECMGRMLSEVEEAVSRKRKEPTDNKLRANVIKKVEEKYGEYYDQF